MNYCFWKCLLCLQSSNRFKQRLEPFPGIEREWRHNSELCWSKVQQLLLGQLRFGSVVAARSPHDRMTVASNPAPASSWLNDDTTFVYCLHLYGQNRFPDLTFKLFSSTDTTTSSYLSSLLFESPSLARFVSNANLNKTISFFKG